MKELLHVHGPKSDVGKQTIRTYKTTPWSQKAKALFFYSHSSLGNMEAELTCSLFEINVNIFGNWICQQKYFPKWYSEITNLTVKDVLPSIPSTHHSKFEHVDASSSVKLNAKFKANNSSKQYVSSTGGNRQSKRKKVEFSGGSVVYLQKDTKTAGSGQKVKFKEQEVFVVETVCWVWETGNPTSKGALYNLKISEFGHEHEADRNKFEMKTGIHTGSITPAFFW